MGAQFQNNNSVYRAFKTTKNIQINNKLEGKPT